MDSSNQENETEKLSKVLSTLQSLYYKKKEQLEELEQEISELQSILTYLNSVISNQSFTSADEIYSKLKKEKPVAKEIADDYFKENISEDKAKGTKIKRKIFSSESREEENLLCVLNLHDFKRLEIKFIDPGERSIQESSVRFIKIFIKEALLKIKEQNPNLDVNYKFYKNTEFIEYIFISNLRSIDDYDLVTNKIRELLATEN